MTDMVKPFRPVFICGCERSGTTLLGSLLGASSKAIVTPESQFLTELQRMYDPADLRKFTDALCRNWRLGIWQINTFRGRLDDAVLGRGPVSYREIIETIIRLYADDRGKSDSRIWIDHTPRHIFRLERILELFPEAKVLNLVRDGRAVAASVLPLDWGPNSCRSAAMWWSRSVGAGALAEVAYGPGTILTVRFEDLVREPDSTLSAICQFSGIEYTSQVRSGGAFVIPKYTKGQHERVNKDLDPSRLDAWREKLSKRDVEIFEYYSGDLLSYLGYRLETSFSPAPPGYLETRWITVREVAVGLLNYFRARLRIIPVRIRTLRERFRSTS